MFIKNKREWKCKYCDSILDTRKELFMHMRENHKHECIYCGQIFESGHQLGTHTIHCKSNPRHDEIRKTINLKTSKRLKGRRLSEEHRKKLLSR